MSRVTYQSGSSIGPFNPASGQRVKRSHAERTFRHVYRLDGSVAATEQRETLIMETDGPDGSLCDARRIARLPTTALGRFWYALKHCALVLFDCAAIVIGSLLAYALAYACTSSVLWGFAGVGLFLLYCTYLRLNA